MYSDFQELYSDPIHEKLFPFYRNLESAVEFLTGASESCKPLYIGDVEKAFAALTAAKLVINNLGDQRDN
ncbi:MAG: hypothetical protein WCE54_03740 [Ignavibacteriaceae bacterium]